MRYARSISNEYGVVQPLRRHPQAFLVEEVYVVWSPGAARLDLTPPHILVLDSHRRAHMQANETTWISSDLAIQVLRA